MEKDTIQGKSLEEYKNILERYNVIRSYFREKGEDYDNLDRASPNEYFVSKIKGSLNEAYEALHSKNILHEDKNDLVKKFSDLKDEFEDILVKGLVLSLKEIGKRHKNKMLERQEFIEAYMRIDPEGGLII